MHPLDSKLEESRQMHYAKRRTSLDNSCLSAPETFRFALPYDENDCDFDDSPRRRLSLNNAVSITTTFLAGAMSHHGSREKQGLDVDFHSSVHGSPSQRSRSKVPPLAESALLSPNAVSDDGSDLEEDLSCGSDCDSFCDASVQEPANREYLRRDLGASCFWNSIDSCSLGDSNGFLGEIGKTVDSMILEEEGHEKPEV
jgi:hypothetical protein